MNKINKQIRNRFIDTENRLIAVEGRGIGELGDIGEGIQQTNRTLRLEQQYGDYQRERGWEEVEESKGGINGDRRRLDFGW